jgi:hypothetical protein
VAGTDRGGTLKPGEVLNNTYIIETLIGAGGTGEVYRARNRASGREMAIKILRREFAQNPAFVNLMRREAEVLHEVVDDAVVRYHDLLESDTHGGFFFLAMEFIRGESLADLMSRGPVDEATLLQIARRVAQGLKAAHSKLAFHRDLSPDNIILRDGDASRAVVIDFGIAKDVSQDARTVVGSGFAGKFQYAAPEQMDGNVDGRSDLYSLGMTLIGAFRGRTPDVGGSFLEVIKSKSRKPDISDMPGLLHALVDRLVEPDPAKRFQSAGEVLEFLSHGGKPPRRAADAPDAGRAPAPERRSVLEEREARPAPRPAAARRGGGAGLWVGLVALIAILGGAGFYFGLGPGRAMLFGPEFPRADPYRFEILVTGPGAMTAAGNAPSPEAAAAFRAALAAINGGRTPEGEIAAASGVPGEGWQPAIVAIARAAGILPAWSLKVAGTAAELAGEAPDQATHDTVIAAAEAAAREGGITLASRITVAVQPLLLATLDREINSFATCGPLEVLGGDGTEVPPGQPVTVAGAVSRAEDQVLIERAVAPLLEGRPLRLKLGVLNVPVCRLMGVLPAEPSSQMTLRYSHGDKAGTVEDSIYRLNENPVVDLELAAADAGYLTVFYADSEGQVFHFLPHNNRPDNSLARVGTVTGDRRSVRLTWPEAEASVAQLGFRVVEPFGVNLITAIRTPRPLFAEMRPRAESIDAFLPALQAALAAAGPDAVVTYRYLATQP